MHIMKSIITYHTYKAGSSGLQFCLNHPLILQKILYSPFGKSFIFFTIANFDPLVSSPSAQSLKVILGAGGKRPSRADMIDGGKRPREGRTEGEQTR